MPTYIYETIPAKKGTIPKRYEIKQSIKDVAFTKHPETGEPIKRVVAGGIGVLTSSSSATSRPHTHTPSCGCGSGGCRA
jgi:predicted nucleic acid-binding Zn ribbon protein